MFAQLAAQCAQLSSTEGILFEKGYHLIRFSPMDDDEFSKAYSLMMAS